MRRTWLVFWHSFWTNISRRSYLLFTFGLPFFIVAIPTAIIYISALVIQTVIPPTDHRPIGVVDSTAVFSPDTFLTSPVIMQPYDDLSSAITALENGEIQAHYHIQPDYWQTGAIILTYDVAPSEEVRMMFDRWLNRQIREQVPPDVVQRLNGGTIIEHQSVESGELFTEDNLSEWILVFMLVYLVRSAGLFTSGYMYDSIASESRHRTIEIILTSIRPSQFVIGKFFGLLCVGLTQLAIWGGGVFLIAVVGTAVFNINLIDLIFNWEHLPLVISMLFAAYVLDQILAAAAGMMRISGGAGPQLFNTLSLATGIALVYAVYFLPRNPDTPFAVAASIFPFTSPIVLLVRIVASEVPPWQISVSQLIIWLTCLIGLWGLRQLLQANLVAHADRFQLMKWLKIRNKKD